MRSPTIPAVDVLVGAGRAAGLDAVGVCTAEVFESTRRDLIARRAEGLHGDMAFTYRNPERSTDAERALAGVRTMVVGARSYPAPDVVAPRGTPHARIAAYARRDHYADLRFGLEAIADVLTAEGWRARVVLDDNAIVDRSAAHRAGLGWFGKNTNILLPGRGSRFVLGSVLTDAALEPAPAPVSDGCGPCVRCLDACPTSAFVRPGVLDARRCLAWLVQAAGVFPREFRVALGDRIYGCDDCQDACPVNRRADRDAISAVVAGEAWVDLLDLLDADDASLLDRHGRWYIAKRDPRYLRRNALIGLGNIGRGHDQRVVAVLGRYLRDPDPLLRAHAVWATRRLGCDDLLSTVEADLDPLVQDELAAAVEPVEK